MDVRVVHTVFKLLESKICVGPIMFILIRQRKGLNNRIVLPNWVKAKIRNISYEGYQVLGRILVLLIGFTLPCGNEEVA